jgi:hypothetical protein
MPMPREMAGHAMTTAIMTFSETWIEACGAGRR